MIQPGSVSVPIKYKVSNDKLIGNPIRDESKLGQTV